MELAQVFFFMVRLGTSVIELLDFVKQILNLVYDEIWHQLSFSFVTGSGI
jgi:hypothetical protein